MMPRRRLVLGALLVLLAACGDSTGPETIVGTYSLRTVNGAGLPYVIAQAGADKDELIDDAFTLNEGGTWTESGHLRSTRSGVVTTQSVVASGTYTRTGTAITLTDGSESTSGTVSAGTLTISDQGVSAVYVR
jgi:hypothetical protein